MSTENELPLEGGDPVAMTEDFLRLFWWDPATGQGVKKEGLTPEEAAARGLLTYDAVVALRAKENAGRLAG